MAINHNFLAAAAAILLLSAPFHASGQTSSPEVSLSTVVIDPGHGGKDAGCVSPSGKTLEKTIVLDIARRLNSKISANCPGVKVIMTRSNDTFVTLQGRADIANRSNADLFISIHVNSVEQKKTGPNGYSVHILGQYTSKNKDLYAGNMDVVRRENAVIKLEDDYTTKYEGFDPSDPESYIFMNLMQNAHLEQSLRFAQYIDKEMKGGAIKASRGISQDPFYVLWRTAMPAVLVECGFMSNPTDRGALITEDGRERIASDLYDAFISYKKYYDGSVKLEKETSEAIGSPEQETSKNVSEDAEVSEYSGETVVYGTQVLATSRQMKKGDPFFEGLDFLEFKSGRMYKYIIGFSNDLE